MKYLIGMIMLLLSPAALVLTSILPAACSSTPAAAGGSMYEGAAMGFRGMIHVKVGMEKGSVTEITVIESVEDQAVGGAAMEELTDLVLMYNTTELDAISGATETSMGFLKAIEDAIMAHE